MKVADIITEFGNYYLQQGQNMTRLVRLLRDSSVTASMFRTIVTDETIYQAAQTVITRLLQPFQKKWTPIAELGFSPIEIRSFRLKMDHEDYPDDLEGTWLGFLADNNLQRKDWPVIRWLIEEELLPQLREDFELNEIYDGVYQAPVEGVAGAAGTAINGIKKIINDHIAAGRTIPITMGAIPTSDLLLVDYMEDFADQLNDKYWGQMMEVATSPRIFRRFARGYAQKYGDRVDYTKNTDGKVDMTNLQLKPLPSHRNTEKIWCTPKNNAIRLLSKNNNMDRVAIEGEDRKVKVWTDFRTGLGFILPGLIFTNDLELV